MVRNEFVINGKFLLAALEGMPRVGRALTEAMDDILDDVRGVQITILAPVGARDAIKLRNITIQEVGSRQGPLWEQIDLPLHLRGRFCLHFTGTAPVFLRNGCVIVHDAQFLTTKKSHNWKSYFLYSQVTPRVARRYRAVTTVSQYAKREILNSGVCQRDDIKVIYNGVDHISRGTPDASVLGRHSLRPHDFILSNGYSHEHKNLRTVFEALRNRPALAEKVILFGSSKKSDFEAKGVEVPDGVRFLGRISDGELIALMMSARMFLFPSSTEGFGLPPLEAMRLRCPTICANAGAMPEVCGEGAIYASTFDASDWRNKIQMLWDDEAQRQALALAGQLRASQFNWRSAADAYLNICLNS